MNFYKSKFEIIKINKFFSKAICPKIFSYKKKKLLFFAGEKNDRLTKIYKINLNSKILEQPDLCFESDSYFQRILSPDIVNINNKFHMFFEGKLNDKTGIFYAKSNDIINWNVNYEPLIFDKKKQIDYGSPRCILHPDLKKYYLYYYKKCKFGKNIYLSILDRDLNILQTYDKPIIFPESTLEEAAVYSPDIHIADSKWHMLYAAWGQKPLKGIIMSAVSKNGIEWSNKKIVLEPNIFEDIKHCSEPSLDRKKNTLDLYYEGCDVFNNWRIIRRTLDKQ